MKKVGIITFHRSYNYGAILQAYSLQKTLEDLGYSTEFIDYLNREKRLKRLSFTKKFKYIIWNNFFKKVFVGNKRIKRSDLFRKKYFKFSTCKYKSENEIQNNPPIYDVYISGSDQIWNPELINNDSTYLLGFVDEKSKKISYGSSFGIPFLPKDLNEFYSKYLSQFDFISTREYSGQKIIRSVLNRESRVVLDPTLLINKDHWYSIMTPPKYKDYILCYHLPGNKKVEKLINNIAKKISKLTGLRIIHIGNREYEKINIFKKSVFNAGPEEYLRLFESASYIVTNSFHGACFSLIFEKSFYSIIDDTIPKSKSRNSRTIDLLNRVNCKERILRVSGNHKIDVESLSLNYSNIRTLLEKHKKNSLNYLKDALINMDEGEK